MNYKKIGLLFYFSILCISNYAQVIFYTNGIDISNSTTIYAGGSIQANPGTTIYNTGTIQLTGNWDNRSTSSIFNVTNGTVEFSGSNQSIGGTTGTNFHNLYLTGGGNYQCTQSISTGGEGFVQNGILALNNSILLLNSTILSIKNTSPFAITRTTGFIDGETTPLAGEGKIKWKKPISCHLYPIRITQHKGYEAVNYNKWDVCEPACVCGKKLDVPVYKFLKEPLIRKYGKEWFKQLEKSAALFLKK